MSLGHESSAVEGELSPKQKLRSLHGDLVADQLFELFVVCSPWLIFEFPHTAPNVMEIKSRVVLIARGELRA